jgi:lipid A 4'-phosphatase
MARPPVDQDAVVRQKWVNPRRHVPLWSATLGFTLLIGLCTVTDIDLTVSARFYDPRTPHHWFLGQTAPWIWFYRYGEYPAILMAVGAALVCLGSLRWPALVAYRRSCVVLVLAVALGPGVLVNGLVKPLWGRPRPRQVVQFGGSQPYRPWWQPGGPGAGHSLPSGHAAMGYVLVAGAVLISCRRRSWPRGLALAGALTYGTLMGVARIIQGGHFVSDVAWAGGLMCVLVIGLQEVLGAFPPADSPQVPSRCAPPQKAT